MTTDRWRRGWDLAVLALTLAPVIGICVLARIYAVGVPQNDYWDVLWLSYQFSEASWSEYFGAMWQPFVDQRMFFPKVLIDVLAQSTGNRHYGGEILLGIGAQIGCLAVIAGFWRRSGLDSSRAIAIAICASSWWLFWPRLLFRFQHHWYSTSFSLVLLTGLLAVRSLQVHRGSVRGLCEAAFWSAIAALSHGSGLVLPIAVAAVLAITREWRPALTTGWVLYTGLLLVLVRSGVPTIAGDQLGGGGTPLELARFFLSSLGPAGTGVRSLAALVLLSIAVVAIARHYLRDTLRSREVAPWLMLLLWQLGMAAATSLHRSHLSESPAPQYVALAVVLPITAMGLVATSMPSFPRLPTAGPPRRAFAVLALCLFFSFVWVRGTVVGLEDARRRVRQVESNWARLRFHEALTARDYAGLFPFERFADELLPGLVNAGAFRGRLTLESFNVHRPTAFDLAASSGLRQIGDAGNLRFAVIASDGATPYLDFEVIPPIDADALIEFDLLGSSGLITFYDDIGQPVGLGLDLEERCQGSKCRVFVAVPSDAPVSGAVHRMRLTLAAKNGEEGALRSFRVLYPK